jgi:hypothetical protein
VLFSFKGVWNQPVISQNGPYHAKEPDSRNGRPSKMAMDNLNDSALAKLVIE